jgi:hypothetical protein
MRLGLGATGLFQLRPQRLIQNDADHQPRLTGCAKSPARYALLIRGG